MIETVAGAGAPAVHQAIETLVAALVTSLGGLLVAIATQVLKKLNLSLSAQQEAKLRYFAERSVHIVEERVQEKGPAKLEQATSMLAQQFPKLHLDELTDVIHAELARQRADVGNQLFQPKAS